MVDTQCVWQANALLGEGPLWVERENAVYWVDILSKRVHRYHLSDGAQHTWDFDVEITSLSMRRQGGFVCTIRDGFAWLDLETRTIAPIQLPEQHIPTNRFNDGKVDVQGRYWAGTMDDLQANESGALYCLHPDLSVQTMDQGYMVSNGPTFSKNGQVVYHTDSKKRVIYAFALNSEGQLSDKRAFARFMGEDEGYPDGMTVDREDCLWVADFGGARIVRYAPSGEVLQVIPMPVPNITSCTFGGEQLDRLFITTASVGIEDSERSRYPLAGGLFAFKPGVSGLPTPLFAG